MGLTRQTLKPLAGPRTGITVFSARTSKKCARTTCMRTPSRNTGKDHGAEPRFEMRRDEPRGLRTLGVSLPLGMWKTVSENSQKFVSFSQTVFPVTRHPTAQRLLQLVSTWIRGWNTSACLCLICLCLCQAHRCPSGHLLPGCDGPFCFAFRACAWPLYTHRIFFLDMRHLRTVQCDMRRNMKIGMKNTSRKDLARHALSSLGQARHQVTR